MFAALSATNIKTYILCDLCASAVNNIIDVNKIFGIIL
jgi:hypothetical protein